jgi:hypothetical protein
MLKRELKKLRCSSGNFCLKEEGYSGQCPEQARQVIPYVYNVKTYAVVATALY